MRRFAFIFALLAAFTSFGMNRVDTVNVCSNAELHDAELSLDNNRGEADASDVKHRLALKTNLLYDAILFPNLEFEWMFNKHWSVGIEGDVAWWKPAFTRVYRLAIISPEVKYHIRPSGPWHGMYVGLFAGGGLYQLEHKHEGYKGEGGMGGVSFGYMWPVGKHLFFEAGIGAGYMSTRYKVYQSLDGHKLYTHTKTLKYFGPLKLKFSIAWRFDIMTKTVKVNSTL